ncbi:MAG: alpha/beta hydrolase [Alphaproteobacteria bacterium]
MAIYVICHGAWSGGWSWQAVRRRLAAAGHEVFTPSYTGLGERAHLVGPAVGLGTHIEDIVSLIEFEDLEGVTLVGHSYGGMVAAGVGDRVPARIRRAIFLDAFVPADGQSVRDLAAGGPPGDIVDGWLVPPMPAPPDTAGPMLAWGGPRHRHQPEACFSEPIRLASARPPFARSYIHCTVKTPPDTFKPFADRLRDDPAWDFHELATGHSPNMSAPDLLSDLLLAIG